MVCIFPNMKNVRLAFLVSPGWFKWTFQIDSGRPVFFEDFRVRRTDCRTFFS